MAIDKAKHDSVKEFAQMMVKSHQEMIQKLDQFDQTAGRDGAGSRNPERAGDNSAEPRSAALWMVLAIMYATQNRTPMAKLAATVNARDSWRVSIIQHGWYYSEQCDPQSSRPPARGQIPGQGGINQPNQPNQGRMGGMTGQVPHMLVALTDQSCDNELQLTKKMLEKHEGGRF